jgi:hypothetical protein
MRIAMGSNGDRCKTRVAKVLSELLRDNQSASQSSFAANATPALLTVAQQLFKEVDKRRHSPRATMIR